MTERLYYVDSHIKEFTALVTSCICVDDGKYEVTLDKTAFFPGGGGQAFDTGTIGSAKVLSAFERDGHIVHLLDSPVREGDTVRCCVDWEQRFRRMQAHSGEHVISGIAHSMFGAENVGFHMGEDGVIVDFDKYLSPEDLRKVEISANRIVMEDRRVCSLFPSREELRDISYRSKREISGQVRLIEIEGCDICACCAPHVARTGEIGTIRILESIRRKGGVRLKMIAGLDALEDTLARGDVTRELSALFSAKLDGIINSVKKLTDERDRLAYEIGGLRRELVSIKLASLDKTDGNLVLFEPDFQMDDLRYTANEAEGLYRGMCVVLSGNDVSGYKYAIASSTTDLRAAAGDINSALNGRGGGKPEMITGSFKASKEKIENFFLDYKGVAI